MIGGELARHAQDLIAERVPFVAATVIRAQRPTSVRAGDAAIVHRDGTIEGFVGGACAEASVRLHALRAMETGEPLVLRILPGEAGAADEPPASLGAVTVQNPCLSGGTLEIFLEPHLPAPAILVVGESPIASALIDLGGRLGYAAVAAAVERVEVAADDAAAVVVASHGHDEERALAIALIRGVPYVGLVASSVRGGAVRNALEVPDELRVRLRTPAGLDIGARTPAEIALAILAEIVACARGRGERRRPGATAASSGDAAHAVADGFPADDGPPASEGPPGSQGPPATGPRRASVARAPGAASQARVPGAATDPVCGAQIAVSDASTHLDLGGRRFYFCCEGCRETFAADRAHADAG
jgi:xanthine dehydrogenase accessory factor